MRYSQHDAKNRAVSLVLAAVVASAAVAALILIVAQFVSSLEGLASVMEASQFGFALWRLSLFLLLIGAWPTFTVGYANRVGLSADQTASLKTYRWRMAVWLLVMEALFCQTLWLEFARTLVELEAWAT